MSAHSFILGTVEDGNRKPLRDVAFVTCGEVELDIRGEGADVVARRIVAQDDLVSALDNFCRQIWAADYHANRNREAIRAAYDQAVVALRKAEGGAL